MSYIDPASIGTPTTGFPISTAWGQAVQTDIEYLNSYVAIAQLNAGGIQYVSTAGNDSNNGLTWGTAKATIQAAINALPTGGGLVEIGHGTFTITSPIVVSVTQPGITIRGRGMGQIYDATNNLLSPVFPTTIKNNGTGDAIQFTGPSNIGPSGTPPPYGCVISDLAIVGNTSSGVGINVQYCPRITIQRVVCDQNGTWGASIGPDVYWVKLNQFAATRNGPTTGAAVAYGGLNLVYPVNLVAGYDCTFLYNNGVGANLSTASAVSFVGTDFERTTNNGYTYSGIGCLVQNKGPYSFLNCWFEANANQHYRPLASGGKHLFYGCYFEGDNASNYAILTVGGNSESYDIVGGYFHGHSSGWSILNSGNAAVRFFGVQTLDSSGWIQGPGNVAATNFGTTVSVGGIYGSSFIRTVASQTLAANGAVTINAASGDTNQVTLNANATSSSITNGAPGQLLTIEWIQGTGSNTYVWPPNCKFAAGAAPTASTTASYRDSVTFRFDGTNWYETARAVGVH